MGKKTNLIIIICILCLIPFLGHSQKEGASIRFKETEKNLGQVAEGMKHSYSFRFRNMGKEPLIIRSVGTSCGCLSAIYPNEPILSGKEGSIEVTYNSLGHKGVFIKSYTVHSNDVEHPKIELNLSGTLIRMPVNPPQNKRRNETPQLD